MIGARGFVQPIEIHVSSSHLLIFIGLKTGEKKTKSEVKGIDIQRYKNTKQTESTIKKQFTLLNETTHKFSEDSLAQAILDTLKKGARDLRPKKKVKKQRQTLVEPRNSRNILQKTGPTIGHNR